jgi:hypothetical protein
VLTVGVAIFYTSEGLNSVSWPDIVAKVIPVRIRGRFLGAGQLLSSAGALVASYLVRDVLEGWGIHFPGNWALMFALASVGLFLSVLLIFVIREEPDDKTPTRVDVRRNLADMFGFLRVDGRLRRVVGAQLALGVAAAAFPFLVIRAQELLTDGGALVSNFLVMRNLGGMVAARSAAISSTGGQPRRHPRGGRHPVPGAGGGGGGARPAPDVDRLSGGVPAAGLCGCHVVVEL